MKVSIAERIILHNTEFSAAAVDPRLLGLTFSLVDICLREAHFQRIASESVSELDRSLISWAGRRAEQ